MMRAATSSCDGPGAWADPRNPARAHPIAHSACGCRLPSADRRSLPRDATQSAVSINRALYPKRRAVSRRTFPSSTKRAAAGVPSGAPRNHAEVREARQARGDVFGQRRRERRGFLAPARGKELHRDRCLGGRRRTLEQAMAGAAPDDVRLPAIGTACGAASLERASRPAAALVRSTLSIAARPRAGSRSGPSSQYQRSTKSRSEASSASSGIRATIACTAPRLRARGPDVRRPPRSRSACAPDRERSRAAPLSALRRTRRARMWRLKSAK